MSRPTILLPLDGTPHARVALPVAQQLAALEHALLHVVYVSPSPVSPSEAIARVGLRDTDLRGAVFDTRAGEPAAVINQLAADVAAAMVVLCTHTAATPVPRTIGRTALAVLCGAPCPVVVVRPERDTAAWRLRRLLLPHDATPTTSEAIGPAVHLARDAGAELAVLHVAQRGTALPREQGSLPTPRYMDQPQHEWPAWMGEFLERLSSICPLEKVAVRLQLAHGDPATEVLHAAASQPTDLVVLAWRGHWEGAHAGTLKAVVREAPCPILVVRAHA